MSNNLPLKLIPKLSINESAPTELALSADGSDISNNDEMFGGDIVSDGPAVGSVVLLSNGLGVLRVDVWTTLGAGGGVESKGSVTRAFCVIELVTSVETGVCKGKEHYKTIYNNELPST